LKVETAQNNAPRNSNKKDQGWRSIVQPLRYLVGVGFVGFCAGLGCDNRWSYHHSHKSKGNQ